MSANLYGSDFQDVKAGGFIGEQPPDTQKPASRAKRPVSPMIKWCRKVESDLKRERSTVTEEMRRNTNLARGGTPWWKNRPKWKIGTRLNFCATVPLTWTAILTDAKPSVSYTALDRKKQRRADIATAAWTQAYTEGNWEARIH